MKDLRCGMLTGFCSSLIFVSFINAQSLLPEKQKIRKFDIDSKFQELVINVEQRQERLNSFGKNGGGDPYPEAMEESFFTGQAADDLFGKSVSSAGDVNGDGYADLIVGAIQNDAGGNSAGRAYIYYGGIIVDNVADVVITGVSSGNLFGWSVSTAGDLNGDGYSDVIVSAVLNDVGGIDAGSAYIYFGGSSMDNATDVTLTGAAAGDQFGYSVSTAGDINGDGYSDVIVGAILNDAGGSDAGRAYIYFGSASMDNTADVTLTGAVAGDQFGYSVSTAGDVNGDGYADVIIGATLNDAGGTDAGSAYIYFGGTSMDNAADLTMTGFASADRFGFSVSTGGDIDGNGYSDVIIGAYTNDAGGNNAGRAYIYFGSASMDNTADITLTGAAAGDFFGYSVSTAGDVNGDGFSDVIIGAYSNDAGGVNAGRAYIFFGSISMDKTPDVIVTGAATGDFFGYSVSTAGDVNSDGYSDVIVGARNNDAGGTDAGRAYLYTNSLTGSDIPDEFFTGQASEDDFGHSVSTAGDVNGDGYSDLIVGAPENDFGGNAAGRAYIYFGGPLLDNIADVILTGETADDRFGNSVSPAGDVNGDGFDDVIVGAYFDNAGGIGAGRAFIYFGGQVMDDIADVVLTGQADLDQFGHSVSDAGDVNGDGFSDVIVGVPLTDSAATSAGSAYIYLGGTTMDDVADVVITGDFYQHFLGYSVANAGDVNADGYSDVIVGATGFGWAYIYFGGLSMDNIDDVLLFGEASGDLFGRSVSGAGDVNGDGYSDVVVGAKDNDAGGNNAGRVYIYFGGSSMDNQTDVIMTGETAEDLFGYSVSTAGDVNADGYSDIILGAVFNDAGGSNAGQAYIYFGGREMDTLTDIVLTGDAAGDLFGYWVAAAGDVNNDGYSDVIVGALLNDAGGNDAGTAYLYLSSSPPIKPRVMSVKDVPYDQGGYVFVNLVRSGYDAIGENNIITEYLVEMSNPPGPAGFSWIQIGSVQPVQNPLYTFLAQTPNDSMTNYSGTYYFRVTARTSDPNLYWRSNIMYGHSVDNLAPLPPFNFYAALNSEDVKLGWKANTEQDFRDYQIYRSDIPFIDDSELIGTTTDTTFIDSLPFEGSAYYFVQAYDIHNNSSPHSSDSVIASLSANIRVFLEGAYVGGQMSTFINSLGLIPLSQPFNIAPWNYSGTETVSSIPSNVTDWILVELRSTTTTVVERRAAFITNDGTLVDLDGESTIKFASTNAGEYYIVIIHRNHLSVMTSTPISISFSPELYDMRTDVSKAFGSNAMKSLGGGYFGINSADTDGSGTVNATDRSNTWNQRNLSGYYGTDVDLSGTVNAADRSSVWNNRNISTQVPAPVDNSITEMVKKNNN